MRLKTRISSPQAFSKVVLVIASATLLVLAAGCTQNSESSLSPEEQKELAQLRQQAAEAETLRNGIRELPRLQKDSAELPRLREQSQELEKLRAENKDLQKKVAGIRASQAEQAAAAGALAAQQANQNANTAAPPPAAVPEPANEVGTGEIALQPGDKFFIDRSLLPLLLPNYPTNQVQTGLIEITALLSLNKINTFEQLHQMGITNYQVLRGETALEGFQGEEF